MGLRLTRGINLSKINSKYNINLHEKFPKIKEMKDLKLLAEEDGYLKLTKEGIFLGNQVFQIFV
jgi:oxygen-independent coproporphyrinogen-3 oxidase